MNVLDLHLEHLKWFLNRKSHYWKAINKPRNLIQIYIGVVSNIIVFPVNFAIVWLFRKARPKNKRKSRIKQALVRQEEAFKRKKQEGGLPYEVASPATSSSDLKPILEESPSPVPDSAYTQPLQPAAGYDTTNPTTITLAPHEPLPPKKKKFSLPWWFIIVGWAVLWIATLVSAIFTVFYGIQFGDLKTKKWITSLVVTFLTSIFLTQPIKVSSIVHILTISKPILIF